MFTSGLSESKTSGAPTRPRHRAKRIKVPQRWQGRLRTRYQVNNHNYLICLHSCASRTESFKSKTDQSVQPISELRFSFFFSSLANRKLTIFSHFLRFNLSVIFILYLFIHHDWFSIHTYLPFLFLFSPFPDFEILQRFVLKHDP